MSRIPPALVVAAVVALALAGCTVPSLSHPRTGGSVDSVRALQLGWRTPASSPEWVPAGSTGIRFTATTNGPADETPASVRVTTTGPLPASCTTTARPSAAALVERWAPSTVPDRVQRCGNWAVVEVPGGWYGWTPFAPTHTG
jgi:hypothetical protein